MKKSTIKKIEALCPGDISFVGADGGTVTCLLPYSNQEIPIEVEGNTEVEQLESFVSAVNQALDDMIDHLGDCKLDYPLAEGSENDGRL